MKKLLAVILCLCLTGFSLRSTRADDEAGGVDTSAPSDVAPWKADSRMRKQFMRFDFNHDGKLGPREREAMRRAWRHRDKPADTEKAKRIFDHADKNDDGAIGPAERAAVRRAHADRAAHARNNLQDGDGPPVQALKRFDRNGDGSLNEVERAAAKRAHHHKRHHNAAKKKHHNAAKKKHHNAATKKHHNAAKKKAAAHHHHHHKAAAKHKSRARRSGSRPGGHR